MVPPEDLTYDSVSAYREKQWCPWSSEDPWEGGGSEDNRPAKIKSQMLTVPVKTKLFFWDPYFGQTRPWSASFAYNTSFFHPNHPPP